MSDSGDDAMNCPLCMEEMDLDDMSFYPCECDYQICRFCYHRIIETFNGKCPACRRVYSEKNVRWKAVSPETLAKNKAEKKAKEREKRELEIGNKKHLANVRVIQRNLAYVVGLPPHLATEEGSDYFGQFGKINKIVINKKQIASSRGGEPIVSVGAYVTFASKEDTAKAIQTVDGSTIENRLLRATYGTTKYCSYYLKGIVCQNPNCMYLHEPGEEADYSQRDENSKSGFRPLDSISSAKGYPPKNSISGNLSPNPQSIVVKNNVGIVSATSPVENDSSVSNVIQPENPSHSKTFASIISVPSPDSLSTLKSSTSPSVNVLSSAACNSALPPSASWGSKTTSRPPSCEVKKSVADSKPSESVSSISPLDSSSGNKNPAPTTESSEEYKPTKTTAASILKSGVPNTKTQKQPWGNNIHPMLQQLSRERKEQLKRQANKSDLTSPKSRSECEDFTSSESFICGDSSKSTQHVESPDISVSIENPQELNISSNFNDLPTTAVQAESHSNETPNFGTDKVSNQNKRTAAAMDDHAEMTNLIIEPSNDENETSALPVSSARRKDGDSLGLSHQIDTSEYVPTNPPHIASFTEDSNSHITTSSEGETSASAAIQSNNLDNRDKNVEESKISSSEVISGDSFIKNLLSPTSIMPPWSKNNSNSGSIADFSSLANISPQEGAYPTRSGIYDASGPSMASMDDYPQSSLPAGSVSSVWGSNRHPGSKIVGLNPGIGQLDFVGVGDNNIEFGLGNGILGSQNFQSRGFNSNFSHQLRSDGINPLIAGGPGLQFPGSRLSYGDLHNSNTGSKAFADSRANDSGSLRSFRERSRFGFAQNHMESGLGSHQAGYNAPFSRNTGDQFVPESVSSRAPLMGGLYRTQPSIINSIRGNGGSSNKIPTTNKLSDFNSINHSLFDVDNGSGAFPNSSGTNGSYNLQNYNHARNDPSIPALGSSTDPHLGIQGVVPPVDRVQLRNFSGITGFDRNIPYIRDSIINERKRADSNLLNPNVSSMGRFKFIGDSISSSGAALDSGPSTFPPVISGIEGSFSNQPRNYISDFSNRIAGQGSGLVEQSLQDPSISSSAVSLQDPAILRAQLTKTSVVPDSETLSSQHLTDLLARLNVGGSDSLSSGDILDPSGLLLQNKIDDSNRNQTVFLSDPAIMSLGRNKPINSDLSSSKQSFPQTSLNKNNESISNLRGSYLLQNLSLLPPNSAINNNSNHSYNSKIFGSNSNLNPLSGFNSDISQGFFHNDLRNEPPEKQFPVYIDSKPIISGNINDNSRYHSFDMASQPKEPPSSIISDLRNVSANNISVFSTNHVIDGVHRPESTVLSHNRATPLNPSDLSILQFASPSTSIKNVVSEQSYLSSFDRPHSDNKNQDLLFPNDKVNGKSASNSNEFSNSMIINSGDSSLGVVNFLNASLGRDGLANRSESVNPGIDGLGDKISQLNKQDSLKGFESKIFPVLSDFLSRNAQHISSSIDLEKRIAQAYKEAVDFDNTISSLLDNFSSTSINGNEECFNPKVPIADSKLGSQYINQNYHNTTTLSS
ncbi:General negative regulator of transcription subunit 4 [Smittium mucronatum]|uniref:General negative regulator of transcription subunit 4 n=1 Tax=Smittium mucronatum TaxID=133383 RepID=A0A1R0GYC8_9FUNG|nr:General negative regulator of transcription subunit 4 [Smittium mucronatum]